eukprot:Nk52_evm20s1073 gene=Nk52_evmTU20s1073
MPTVRKPGAAGKKKAPADLGKKGKGKGDAKKAAAPEEEEQKKDQDLLDDNFDDQWMQPKTLQKPEGQLELSEEELKKEYTRILSANNPRAPKNIVRYNFKEYGFRAIGNVDQHVMHFEMDGYLLYKHSDEAKRQLQGGILTEDVEEEKDEEGKADEAPAEDAPKEGEEGEEGEAKEGEEEGEGEETEEKPADEEKAEETEEAHVEEGGDAASEVTLRNQFNFSERASQTLNFQLRERASQTEPPPRCTYSGNVTQWEIYDAYCEDYEKQKAAKEKKDTKPGKGVKDEDKKVKLIQSETSTNEDLIHNTNMLKSATIIERMVNQNTFDDISQDFKYWEDASDEFKEGEGSLLPLWKFNVDKTKHKTVTSLCWNPHYHDMFAAGYGSYDFLKQGGGLLCCFTLKNPSHPSYIYSTESGVMCIDFNSQHPSLIAVGLYDGSVAIYDLQKKSPKPIAQSTTKSGKHTDPVWQVAWQEDDLDKNLNFFSVSSDGRVTSWTLVKSELHNMDVIELKMNGHPKEAEPNIDGEVSEDMQLFGLQCGTAFDFSKVTDHLFLVGTEEGKIHKCSKAYNSQYLATYDAHHMAVYAVKWNYFHPKVYISCSSDWTVKIWDHTEENPIYSFDLNNAVGDVSWAPYSSTVFAAVTSDGKVHVYDLNCNKYEAICEQAVVRKAKLTHLSFNPHYPVLIVGDDRGSVTALKLSPNLRKRISGDEKAVKEQHIENMEKLLSVNEKSDDK